MKDLIVKLASKLGAGKIFTVSEKKENDYPEKEGREFVEFHDKKRKDEEEKEKEKNRGHHKGHHGHNHGHHDDDDDDNHDNPY